ncbi:MAG: BlaI/MecI/CopY family transcriptional regulator [Bacteroidota bacterium]
MQKLAKREEQLMLVLWDLKHAFTKEIIAALPDDPKPHYNTVATIIKILEDKGFVDHESFGKSHRYFPLVSKEEYQQEHVSDLVSKYFDNSYLKMVTHFAKKDKISKDELESIMNLINKGS